MLKANQLIGFGGKAVVAGDPPTGDTPVYPGYLFIPGGTAGHYMSWTPGTDSSSRRMWTLSSWWWLTGSPGFTNYDVMGVGSNFDARFVNVVDYDGNNYKVERQTNAIVGRDSTTPMANGQWYHVVVAANGDATTGPDAFRTYIDGAEITYSTDNRADVDNGYDWIAITQAGYEWRYGGAYGGQIGAGIRLSDIYYIDGQMLGPTDFAYDNTGSWEPKQYEGTYGTHGFHLCGDDAVAADYHLDLSPNSNDFSRNSLDDADWSAVDGPGGNPPTAFSLTFEGTAFNSSPAAGVHTLAGMAAGAEDANRLLVATIAGERDNTTSADLIEVTIGGVTATSVVERTNASFSYEAIFIAAVPTGTTATVTVNGNPGAAAVQVGLYRMVGAASATADSVYENNANAASTTATLNIDADGGAVYIVHNYPKADTAWTDATEDWDLDNYSWMRSSGAHKVTTPALPGDVVQVDWSSSQDYIMLGASWSA